MAGRRATGAAGGFRPDIQGLRAIAVLLVVGYHLWPRALPGGYVGVDVFFVISGYLITSLLVREIETTGSISLPRFYQRRARRLLPASLVTLLAVLLAVACFVPATQWRDTGEEVAASALYLENWRLAAESVDYLAVDSTPSVVQHFWSLSVEEQFYLGWPLFLLMVELAGRRLPAGIDRRRVRAAALLAVIAASLTWSVHLGLAGSTTAYFSTFTRIWQLASGGLLAALALPPGRLARPALVAGLAAIAASAVLLSDATPYPGYAALAPTVGALLAIHGGQSWQSSRLTRWLGVRPVQWIGDISYSLYLWHWPIISIQSFRTGEAPGPVAALVMLGLAVALAALSKRFVEDPFRRGWRRSRRVVLATAVLSTASCVALAAALHQSARVRQRVRLDPARHPGAAALTGRPAPDLGGGFLPPLVDVESDVASAYDEICIQDVPGTAVKTCVYGRRRAARRIALIGDSHAIHWIPAFQELVEPLDLQLVAISKTSCAFSLRAVHHFKLRREYTECLEWTRNVIGYLADQRFDRVLVAQSPRHSVDGAEPRASVAPLAAGVRAALDAVARSGSRVTVLRATPWQKRNPRDCVAVEAPPYSRCASSRAEALPDDALALAAREGGYPVVDLTDLFCPGERCPPIIGNVFVYRDAHHITASYMRTLAPMLAEELGFVALQ